MLNESRFSPYRIAATGYTEEDREHDTADEEQSGIKRVDGNSKPGLDSTFENHDGTEEGERG